MTVNHPQFGTMCAICFAGLTPDECAIDEDGQRWDLCGGTGCAAQAGITEAANPALRVRHPGIAALLWNADPTCAHNIVDGLGGGIRCTQCEGWRCD